MLICQNLDEATTALNTLEPTSVFTHSQDFKERPVVFMFSGQGAQYVNMGLELYQTEPSFREQVDFCSEYLKPHLGLDLRQVLYPNHEEQISEATQQLNQTAITQTALLVIEYALAKLWMSWGIYPEAMIGHSIGEYVAACLSGVFSLEEALSLVAARGQMMQDMPHGAMLAVSLPEEKVQSYLGNGLSLAAINTPSLCVVSGFTEAVDALETQLSEQGVECRRLHTSHAFHSEMMAPILAPFTERVAAINFCGPKIPYLSNVTGNWITAAEATEPDYWSQHLRQTVRFADGLGQLLKNSARILLEVGPGRTLTTNARRHPDKAAEQVVLSSLRHPQEQQSDVAFLLNTVGKLWLHGGEVDWSGFYANERRYRLPLPTYPFERQRYWIEPSGIHQQIKRTSLPETEPSEKVDSTPRHSRPNLLKTYVAPRNELEQMIADVWEKSLGIEQVGIYDDFFELGGDSLLAVQLITKLRKTRQTGLSAHSLLNAPTIAALAELIEKTIPELPNQYARQTLPSTLVEIKTGNRQKSPLFLVHPVGGHVYFYRDLASYLSLEQPVYGIQAQGLDGETEPLTQIEEMATHYIKVMRVRQPEGPYFIGGSSFGGTVAFEMAQQLHALGQQVALLTMIDTPGLGQMPKKFNTDAEIIAYLLEVGANISVSLDELRLLEPDEQIAYAIEKGNLRDLSPVNFRHFLYLFKVNMEAMFKYKPQVYPGRILFFRAKEQDTFNAKTPELAWIDLAAEGIEIYVVPGNHITMNERPHVQLLAKRLNICLEQAQADD